MFDYYGGKWKQKRKHILRLDGYVDRIEKRYGRTVEAAVVHHIYPADEYPEYAWCDWNLISISLATHNRLEDRKTGKLTKLGLELQRDTVPGVDWRNTSVKKRCVGWPEAECRDERAGQGSGSNPPLTMNR